MRGAAFGKRKEVSIVANENQRECPAEPVGQISEEDAQILKFIHELSYGKVVITVRDGKAVHAEIRAFFFFSDEINT